MFSKLTFLKNKYFSQKISAGLTLNLHLRHTAGATDSHVLVCRHPLSSFIVVSWLSALNLHGNLYFKRVPAQAVPDEIAPRISFHAVNASTASHWNTGRSSVGIVIVAGSIFKVTLLFFSYS